MVEGGQVVGWVDGVLFAMPPVAASTILACDVEGGRRQYAPRMPHRSVNGSEVMTKYQAVL